MVKLNYSFSGMTILLVCIMALPFPAAAQSVEACLQAKRSAAIDICEQTLENGSRDQNVYFKLASELYQQGRGRAALDLIDDGLKSHPDNVNLIRLKNYVELDTVEQDEPEESATKNEAVIKLGKLKIICRTKESTQGIKACREYLSKTNVDKALIAQRLAALENKQSPQTQEQKTDPAVVANTTQTANTQPAIAPAAQNEPEPIKAETVESTTANVEPATPELTEIEAAAISKAENALRVLVFDVQTNLVGLGFNTGTPDGIPGVRTRKALTSFYSKSNIPDNEFSENGFISESTLRDLISANNDRLVAENILKQSRNAAEKGNAATALLKLNQAEETSDFISVPQNYRDDLKASILAQLQSEQTEEAAEQPKAPDTEVIINPTSSTLAVRDATTLMDQIKRLETKLAQQEERLRESLKLIDDVATEISF